MRECDKIQHESLLETKVVHKNRIEKDQKPEV